MEKQPGWKTILTRLKLDSIKNSTPAAFEASGGYSMKIKPYNDNNTNGLTRCVQDFLSFKGHYCIRSNNQGQAWIERIPMANGHVHKKLSWRKNPDGKGKADLQASLYGHYISIEIKCLATKDRQSDDQKRHMKMVESSGGIYLIVQEFEPFYNWYNDHIDKFKNNQLKL